MIEFEAVEICDPPMRLFLLWVGSVIMVITFITLFTILLIEFGAKTLLILPPLGVFLLFKSGYVKFKSKRKRTEAD